MAIRSETEDEFRRIRNDFIAGLVEELARSQTGSPFHVLEIPPHLTPTVNDKDAAIDFLKQSKSHLLIWGAIKKRAKGGKDVYSLKLDSIVIHAPIPDKQSQALSQEMRVSIPPKTEIALENELREFETVSTSLALGTKYIVALVSAISGDLKLSKLLLGEVQSEVKPAKKADKAKSKPGKTLAGRLNAVLPRMLAEVNFAEFFANIKQWQEDRSKLLHLEHAEQALEQFLLHHKKIAKEGPEYWVPKAMLMVTLHNRIDDAHKTLAQCLAKGINDPSWRLSLAFVKAIRGEYVESLNLYDAALALNPKHGLLFDVEAYIQWWVDEKGGPKFLYLLLAMLNADGKHDLVSAKQDLERFYESMGDSLNADEQLTKRADAFRAKLLAHV
jgi:tetratricopeptide (TPR) repeat protein